MAYSFEDDVIIIKWSNHSARMTLYEVFKSASLNHVLARCQEIGLVAAAVQILCLHMG